MKRIFLFCGIGLVVLAGGLWLIKFQTGPTRSATIDAVERARDIEMVTLAAVEGNFPRLKRDCQSSPQALQQIQALEAQYKLARRNPTTLTQLHDQAKATQPTIAAQLPADKAAQFNFDFANFLSALRLAANPQPFH